MVGLPYAIPHEVTITKALQSGEDATDVSSCRSLSGKEPLLQDSFAVYHMRYHTIPTIFLC